MSAIALDMAKNGKLFENCIKNVLKLYAQWIQDFSKDIQEYAREILQVTFKFMKSSHVNTKVRELSAGVVYGLVQVKILPDDEIGNVLQQMLRSYCDSRNIKVYCEYF